MVLMVISSITGLAIAGEGGVASSKPIATAVVGPGGLAVARPVATAIAGVSASEVSALGIPLNKFKAYVQAKPYAEMYFSSDKKYGLAQGSGQGRDRLGVLVGPDYQSTDSDTSGAAEKLSPIPADDTVQVDVANDAGQRDSEQQHSNIDDRDDELSRRLTSQENELVASNPSLHVQHPISVEQFQQQQFQPYSFVPATSPFRYNWHPESVQLEQAPRYEQLAYFDQRAGYGVPQQYYPFHPQSQQHLLPINPYQYRGHYN